MAEAPITAYVDQWINAKEMNRKYPDSFNYDEERSEVHWSR